LTQAAAKYGEVAPNAAACCNACRTCVQTNLLAAALAGVAAVGSSLARFVAENKGSRRRKKKSEPAADSP
jgi:hypothetical protein